MDPIITLYEREAVDSNTLPAALATLYDGGLSIPDGTAEGLPYVLANFVETIDGIVSYNAPGQTGGGVISGDKEQDKMVMGLLRARVDAVIFGSSSLYADANHPRTPEYIYRPLDRDYAQYRALLGRRERYPLSVIMTTSGNLDLNDRTFHTPDLRILIATTVQGRDVLTKQDLPPSTEVRVIPSIDGEATSGISPKGVLTLLAREYGVRTALYEGGPTLLSSFLAARLVNELFLTFAPQIAGQAPGQHRLALVEGYAFAPNQAPWGTLLSVKLADNHLLLRYKFS